MTYAIAGALAFVLTLIVYSIVGWGRIADCMGTWTKREYWTNYNTVEFAAWATKAAVIVPGLVLGEEIWWLHIFTLATSAALIWASMKKLLPTLVAFNTLWIFLSSAIIVRHFAGS
ncbi:MAG: hypothetical protein AAFR21_12590 [Pseudomonadota bacterium]